MPSALGALVTHSLHHPFLYHYLLKCIPCITIPFIHSRRIPCAKSPIPEHLSHRDSPNEPSRTSQSFRNSKSFRRRSCNPKAVDTSLATQTRMSAIVRKVFIPHRSCHLQSRLRSSDATTTGFRSLLATSLT
ncbi:unnamed protein product, partial [Mycena citricolor]